jgi:hypothetical protein
VDVHKSVQQWARTVFGAPRRFVELIASIESRDEVIERVALEINRRDVEECRAASHEQAIRSPRVEKNAVDPFGSSLEGLRTQSEYVAACDVCDRKGECPCDECSGSGRSACGTCNGTGKTLSQARKNSRWVQCRVCRAKGDVRCSVCGGRGEVTCTGCSGSGNQLVWLTYRERTEWRVVIEPRELLSEVHPQLSEKRPLETNELAVFSVLEQRDVPWGSMQLEPDSPAVVQRAVASLHSRLERAQRVQHLKLAIVRRDVTYNMCGMSGRLVLSGRDLKVAPTAEALAPIRRRLCVWGWSTAVIAIALGCTVAALHGASSYFAARNRLVVQAAFISVLASVPTVASLLRVIGPRLKLTRLTMLEKALAIVAVAASMAVPALGVLIRPTLAEARANLANGDPRSAKNVIDGLKEIEQLGAEGRALESESLLALANTLEGTSRLAVLDEAATGIGVAAQQARATAREERLQQIRAHLDAGHPGQALDALDAWFAGSWKGDSELAEQRARAYDLTNLLCADELCRFIAAADADAAADSQVRRQELVTRKQRLVEDLTVANVPGETNLARIKRLNLQLTFAGKVAARTLNDSELVRAAARAQAEIAARLAKVPLIGAEVSVVEELLGATAQRTSKTPYLVLSQGLTVYLSLDSRQRCIGVYVVGSTKDARAIRGRPWTADALVSQATGRAATVSSPTFEAQTVSRSTLAGIPVVARWNAGEIWELRIGNAAP